MISIRKGVKSHYTKQCFI